MTRFGVGKRALGVFEQARANVHTAVGCGRAMEFLHAR